MTNDKTIKQLADELGVSKDKVKYQARKLPSELTYKIKGITYLNSQAVSIITGNVNGKKSGDYPEKLPSELPSYYLVEQLKIKDAEISEKNKQLERMMDSNDKLQKLLDQQQILTLQANKKIEELELKNEEPENGEGTEGKIEKEPQEKNKSFFQRLFGKWKIPFDMV